MRGAEHPRDVAATQALLEAGGYVADRALATTVHLALAMGRPILLEGEPGTGKTEIAKVLAAQLQRWNAASTTAASWRPGPSSRPSRARPPSS